MAKGNGYTITRATVAAIISVATDCADKCAKRARDSVSLVLACAVFLAAAPLTSGAMPFSNMYVFGDSLSDSGNLYDWTGRPNPVTDGTPIPVVPPYFPGRFLNGPNYADLLWNGLGFPGKLTPSFFPGGTNYAVGGARSRYHAFDLGPTGVPGSPPYAFREFSLLGQFESFSKGVKTADPNALYVVWGGANDLQDVLTLAGAGASGLPAARTRLGEAVGDVVSVIDGLIGLGARDLLVPNIPNLGLVPAVRDQGSGAQAAGAVFSQTFNSSVDAALARFGGVPDLEITRFDTFGLVQELVDNRSAYGLSNVADPCLVGLYVAPAPSPSVCLNPGEYLFWDIVHPSARTHDVFAAAMLRAVPEPSSLLLLGIALVGLLYHRSRPPRQRMA